MRKRDLTLDLYRVVMMFGIVLFHAVNSCGHQDFRLSSNLAACVDAFALLSGYFGIRFSWVKTLRLWGLAAFIALAVSAADFLFPGSPNPYSLHSWLRASLMTFGSYWFLHAYVFMSFFAPLVNNAFAYLQEKGTRRDAILLSLPFLLAVFVWGFLGEYPKRLPLWPQTPGLEAFSGLTLLGVYIIGRLIRLFDLFKGVKTWQWVLVFVLCLILNPARFGFYLRVTSSLTRTRQIFLGSGCSRPLFFGTIPNALRSALVNIKKGDRWTRKQQGSGSAF